MADRKREIYLRLENIKEIVDLLAEVKTQGDDLKKLFIEYDKLNLDEEKIFENWTNHYEDIFQKLDHIKL